MNLTAIRVTTLLKFYLTEEKKYETNHMMSSKVLKTYNFTKGI